jgi:hypothetical protein
LQVPGAAGGSILSTFNLEASDDSMTIGIGDEQQRQEAAGASSPNLFLNPDWFGPDETLVLTGSSAADYRADVGVAKGPVAPCDPVPLNG